MKKTKIVCTLGPASASAEIMEKMLCEGMNVARLNFSHGTHRTHKEMIDTFRAVRDKLNIPAAIMLDTKGPEIRIGVIEDIKLHDGDIFTLTTEEISESKDKVSISYKDLPMSLSKGNEVLIEDGKIRLLVDRLTDKDIICTVKQGGTLSSNKSINVPRVHLDMPYLSERDKADLIFGVEQKVEFIAASFARRKDDIINLRNFLDYQGGQNIRIIAKIENIEGVENFDEILSVSDGIMIARGDMGVEVEFEKLPGLQKRFIKKCYQSGKMVITATQMLESMVQHQSPTRAEITDVANAVFDGTSAVMLSGESAIGKHPVGAVSVMSKIVCQAEQDYVKLIKPYESYDMDSHDITNAICDATCTTARDLKAKAIIAVTKSGQTARRMSKFRPNVLIIAATPEINTYHQLALSWGVYPVIAKYQSNSDALFLHAMACARQQGLIEKGDCVVITAGIPLSISGNTNILKVEIVE